MNNYTISTNLNIYPLIVIFDKYGGSYSGGLWTAWGCDYEDIPLEVMESDIPCLEFWKELRGGVILNAHHYSSHHLGEVLPFPYGVGNSPTEAVQNLENYVWKKIEIFQHLIFNREIR